jgi:protein SCO1
MLRKALTSSAALLLALPATLRASEEMGHVHALANPTSVTVANYAVPPVQLVNDHGQPVSLRQELDDGRPVVMNFIFTTCETSCPLSSATLSMFEKKLGPERSKVHLVSISIDPEQDTPDRLRAYAEKFHAGPEWQYYTGTLAASLAAQQAFSTYRGDKMSHLPVTLMRAAPGRAWLRIDGFVTPDQLLQHYRELIAGS